MDSSRALQRPALDVNRHGYGTAAATTANTAGLEVALDASKVGRSKMVSTAAPERSLLGGPDARVAVLCVLGPWLLFTVTAWVFSFFLRYSQPGTVAFTAICGAAAVAPFGSQALVAKHGGDSMRRNQTRWHRVIFWTLLISWLSGMVVGECIFRSCMRAYYDTSSLNMYAGVDLSKTDGLQLQDAGIVMFAQGTKLDRSRAAIFRQARGDVFCAAPIVPTVVGNSTMAFKLASYDFWAVGLNCCLGVDESFDCGEYSNPYARAGLRVTGQDDSLEALYKTAIQSAEAKFGIRARSPLLFRWMQDPIAATAANLDVGFNRFLFASLLSFAAQLFVATLTAASSVKNSASYLCDRTDARSV